MSLRDGGSAYRRFSEPTRNCFPEGSSHRQNELQTKSHAAEGRDKKKAKTMAGIAKHKIPMLLKDEAGPAGWGCQCLTLLVKKKAKTTVGMEKRTLLLKDEAAGRLRLPVPNVAFWMEKHRLRNAKSPCC